jgi:lysylphosphatidylglycerol synthetase-like protein (DUF2156 family)
MIAVMFVLTGAICMILAIGAPMRNARRAFAVAAAICLVIVVVCGLASFRRAAQTAEPARAAAATHPVPSPAPKAAPIPPTVSDMSEDVGPFVFGFTLFWVFVFSLPVMFACLWAYGCWKIAKEKGFDPGIAALLGFFLGIIALVVYLARAPNPNRPPAREGPSGEDASTPI